MGFGGVSGMITSLKNNNRRRKHVAFDGWNVSEKNSKGIPTKEISEKTRQEIRDKLKKQRKVIFQKNLTAVLLTVALLLCGIIIYFIK